MPWQIREDTLDSPPVLALLREHLNTLAPTAPRESRHALNLDGLRAPDVTFWSIWDGAELAGFGALKELSPEHGEVKSMRTARAYLRQGVASAILHHIINEARRRGYSCLSLETGSMDFFKPARQLYRSFGFTTCEPFGSYKPDPNSTFMTLTL